MSCDNIYIRSGALLITGLWIWSINQTLNTDKEYKDFSKKEKIGILITRTLLIGGLYCYTFSITPLPHKLLK